MDDNDLTNALEHAGLSPYQADALVALVDVGAASAAEIADRSGVPAPRIYDVLRDLEEKGYVEVYEQGSLHARVRDPSSVTEDLESRASRFSRAAETIEERWAEPTMDDYAVSVVHRFETVLDRAATEIEGATNQVQLCANESQFEALAPHLRAARDRGAFVKLCYTDESVDATAPPTDRFEETCTEVRFRTLPSPFVAIVDRRTVCFAPHERSVNEYGIIVDERTHAYVFHTFFKSSLWNEWETIHSERRDDLPRTYVDVRACVRDLEALLADGATVRATVVGESVETGEPVELSGEVVETTYQTGPTAEGLPRRSLLGGVVNLVIDDGEQRHTAGGWGAVLEDVEALRVVVTDVEYSA